MAITVLAEPSAADIQLAIYNQAIGSTLKKTEQFSVPAGVSWCVVGCVLSDAATPSDVETTLVPAIESLSQVTSVNGDQLFGQMPAAIEATGHEAVLCIESRCHAEIGPAGDYFSQVIQNSERVTLPLGKKWCLLVLRVPAALNDTLIAQLETAITGITGITQTEHLIDGTVSSRATQDASLRVTAHIRLEPTE